MRSLMGLAMLGSIFWAISAIAAPQKSEQDDTYPRLETIPIRSASAARNCESEACEPVYRLSPEQLDRLKALDEESPGELIQLAPTRRQRDKRSSRR